MIVRIGKGQDAGGSFYFSRECSPTSGFLSTTADPLLLQCQQASAGAEFAGCERYSKGIEDDLWQANIWTDEYPYEQFIV